MLAKLPIAIGIDLAFSARPEETSVRYMLHAFWPLDRLVADLRAGEIAYAGLTPVMHDHDGSLGEIIPSLEGWCSTFERIAGRLGLPIDLGHMRRIGKRLENGMLLDTADIDRFSAQVERCRQIFMACPVWIRHQCYIDECIAMAVEDLGLREAA